jgi:hypothetical protein
MPVVFAIANFHNVTVGLSEMRDLWDVDEIALANSSPKHLALAIRALCNSKSSKPQYRHGVVATEPASVPEHVPEHWQ